MTTLEAETKFFERHRQRWIADGHEGTWVVIRGREKLGFFDTFQDGYLAGADRYGDGFLVRKVTREDHPETIQRAFWGGATA